MTTVLLIDDDSDVRHVLGRVLRSAGYEVVDAADGKQGLEAFGRHTPDLVITDIIMPNREGLETIASIREMSDVPIIAISGTAVTKNYDPLGDAKLFGANVAMGKPFGGDALLAAVRSLLAAK